MKRIVVPVLVLFVCSSAFAETVSLQEEIQASVERISAAFLEKYPDLTVKKGAIILEFKEESQKAKSKQMGTLIRVSLEEALTNSMVLYVVDRKSMEAIREEMVLSLSGMVDESTAPEIGFLSGAHVLIYGTIVEDGADFRVSVSATDITTGELLITCSFTIPNEEMVAAAENLQYEYVAKNGIGISTSAFCFIMADEMFNRWPPLFANIEAKYRVSRNIMLSAGVLIPVVSDSNYRWDPSQYTDQYVVDWSDFQPDLPTALDGEVGQATAIIQNSLIFHLDGQYTINFSPKFNLGIKLGAVLGPRMQIGYELSSNDGLYVRTVSYDDETADETYVITKDYQEVVNVFKPVFGGRVELCPEIFITPRLALNLTIGYMLTNSAEVRESYASMGDWGFYGTAIDSGYNSRADEAYFGFDPRIMPDGETWTLNLSGLYAGLAFSFFF